MSSEERTGLQTPDTADETNRQQITGPHVGLDQYGRVDHHYFRCTGCGEESTRRSDVEAECECVREEVLA